ncbi:uncharacterized protein LOC126092349 [Schistocerca cancellata]|uniref:uncharacterized protein LOC126092349 n=1 Tax=Schistocerca cancellata TaxID=274614 RepID=UPI00211968F8|nr:uncharacterized protein LOC126092349 [Schistocerca cancellata]
MASPQEQSLLSDLVRFQAQQMTQLLPTINGLVTLQTAATSVPPTPLPVPTPSPPFRAFNPDVEHWPEYIAQLEAHFTAYNVPELEASRLPPPQPMMSPTAPPQWARLRSSPLSVRSPAPDGCLPPPPPMGHCSTSSSEHTQ